MADKMDTDESAGIVRDEQNDQTSEANMSTSSQSTGERENPSGASGEESTYNSQQTDSNALVKEADIQKITKSGSSGTLENVLKSDGGLTASNARHRTSSNTVLGASEGAQNFVIPSDARESTPPHTKQPQEMAQKDENSAHPSSSTLPSAQLSEEGAEVPMELETVQNYQSPASTESNTSEQRSESKAEALDSFRCSDVSSGNSESRKRPAEAERSEPANRETFVRENRPEAEQRQRGAKTGVGQDASNVSQVSAEADDMPEQRSEPATGKIFVRGNGPAVEYHARGTKTSSAQDTSNVVQTSAEMGDTSGQRTEPTTDEILVGRHESIAEKSLGGAETPSVQAASSVVQGNASTANGRSGNQRTDLCLLIVGKTGNGKSSLGNMLLARDKAFPVGRGMMSTTRTVTAETSSTDSYNLKVVDTPDICEADYDTTGEQQREVSRWKEPKFAGPHPDAILLAIRCDVRYTPEEFGTYKRLRELWRDDTFFCDHLFVIFTFGDRLDNDIETEVENSCVELKTVLGDAGGRYLVFNPKDDERRKKQLVKHLLTNVEKLKFVGTERRILIVGHTGTGKSTLGNILLERQLFGVGKGFAITTKETEALYGQREGLKLKVLDTPDVKNKAGIGPDEVMQEVEKWKQLLHPAPHAVLLTVRSDVPFTKDDMEIHREILFRRWKDTERRMIVVFTFGHHWPDNKKFEETDNPYLTKVLEDALGHHVVFKGPEKTDRTELLDQILRLIEEREERDEKDDGDDSHEIRLLIIGKTGSGKSTLGNFLLGRQSGPFSINCNAALCHTQRAQVEGTTLQDRLVVKVVDTPYLHDDEFSSIEKQQREVLKWKSLLEPEPYNILLTVRCDKQFSDTEYALYKEMKRLYGEEFTKRLTVAFTFGDQLGKEEGVSEVGGKGNQWLKKFLQDASEGLKTVLRDASNRHYVFSEKASKTKQLLLVRRFLKETVCDESSAKPTSRIGQIANKVTGKVAGWIRR